MKLEYLSYLADINETHSITKTAQRFYLAQQSLSDKIKNLEAELGVQLLDRSPTGVTLTEACQALLAISAPYLSELSLWQQNFVPPSAHHDDDDLPLQLTIYFSSAYVGTILPKVVNIFQKRFPEIFLLIREKNYDDIFDAISHDACALAFISINDEYFMHKITSYPQLHHQLLSTDSLVGCISTKTHDLLGKPFLTEADFDGRKSVQLDTVPLKNYYPDFFYYRGCNIDFVRRSVQQNDAIAIMPRRVYEALFSNSYFTAKPIAEAEQKILNTALYTQDELHPTLSYFLQLMAIYF